MAAPEHPPRWTVEIVRLLEAGREGEPDRHRLWMLIHGGLMMYARLHRTRLGHLDDADLQDVISQKTLELLSTLDSPTGPLAGLSPGRVRGLLSTVARNGLVDHLRRAGRTAPLEDEMEGPDTASQIPDPSPDPGHEAERNEFLDGLRDCVRPLQPLWRRIWFLRVFYDLSSRRIARHPDVDRRAPHVDVILMRTRRRIADCLRRKGLAVSHLPAGSFAALWESCLEDEELPGEVDRR